MLRAEGHPHADHYPLSKLWIETEIARERINARLATEATLIKSAIVAVLAPKDGGEEFKRLVKRLNDG